MRKWVSWATSWPCRDESDADQGTSYLFKEKFDTPNGLAQFFTCDWVAPIDKLTDEYPMVLSTVREVGHYSCRSMTGNCAALAALADEPGYAQINTADAERLGIEDEALVWVNSRKGGSSPARRSAIVRTKGRSI
jgi:formate dehydrogenase major subunit